MSRIVEVSREHESKWRKWVKSRPPAVRAVAEKFDPWSLYKMKSTGQRVTLYSFGEGEDGRVTLSVIVSGKYNLVMFDRKVFGVDPDDLEPCDPPSEEEVVGTMLDPDEVDEQIDSIRVMTRPDLWIMDENGKAVRKS